MYWFDPSTNVAQPDNAAALAASNKKRIRITCPMRGAQTSGDPPVAVVANSQGHRMVYALMEVLIEQPRQSFTAQFRLLPGDLFGIVCVVAVERIGTNPAAHRRAISVIARERKALIEPFALVPDVHGSGRRRLQSRRRSDRLIGV